MEFLKDYEAVCRKHGMKASATGWEIEAECVMYAGPDEITEHISDLIEENAVDQ